MDRVNLPPRDQIEPDAPLRVNIAAQLAFPDGSMTASGLRNEARRGRLVIERIAGKDYTTLAAIDRMRELCRLEAKAHASTCGAHETTKPVTTHRSGSSATDATSKARAALRTILMEPSEPSPPISPTSTQRPHAPLAATRIKSPLRNVLTIYLRDVVPGHSRPKETKGRIKALDAFFGDRMLSHVTGETCRAYAAQRSTDAAARRELEDLRAATNHHQARRTLQQGCGGSVTGRATVTRALAYSI